MKESPIIIKDKIAKKIYKIAMESKKNSSYHVNIALQNYLDEHEDLKTAVRRLNDKSDPVISSKQLRKSLGL